MLWSASRLKISHEMRRAAAEGNKSIDNEMNIDDSRCETHVLEMS